MREGAGSTTRQSRRAKVLEELETVYSCEAIADQGMEVRRDGTKQIAF